MSIGFYRYQLLAEECRQQRYCPQREVVLTAQPFRNLTRTLAQCLRKLHLRQTSQPIFADFFVYVQRADLKNICYFIVICSP